MYVYDKSEEYRAKLFLIAGGFLGTPFSVIALEWFEINNLEFTKAAFIAFGLWLFGIYLIIKSYFIMESKDRKNDSRKRIQQ